MSNINDSDEKIKNIFIIIFFVITLTLFWCFLDRHSKESEAEGLRVNQQDAVMAMKAECARSCKLYGITQEQLIGPELEHNYTRRWILDYIFSFHSESPAVTLKVHLYQNGANPGEPDSQEKINFEWRKL